MQTKALTPYLTQYCVVRTFDPGRVTFIRRSDTDVWYAVSTDTVVYGNPGLGLRFQESEKRKGHRVLVAYRRYRRKGTLAILDARQPSPVNSVYIPELYVHVLRASKTHEHIVRYWSCSPAAYCLAGPTIYEPTHPTMRLKKRYRYTLDGSFYEQVLGLYDITQYVFAHCDWLTLARLRVSSKYLRDCVDVGTTESFVNSVLSELRGTRQERVAIILSRCRSITPTNIKQYLLHELQVCMNQ